MAFLPRSPNRKPAKYSHDGLAGCVTRRRSRVSGDIVGLYHAEQAGLDATDGPWATVCEKHGTVCNHRTMRLALSHLSNVGWCEACQQPTGVTE